MSTGTLDLIGTNEVAEICGVSRRTVEDWLRKGWLVPELVVARRQVWRRSTIVDWNEANRPQTGNSDDPVVSATSLDVVGVDEIAAARGLARRSVLGWRGSGRLPEPDAIVSGTLIWRRETVSDLFRPAS